MFVRSSIRRNTAVAKLRRLSQAKKHYVNDRNFYLTPQQNEVINCGIVSISAAVLP
jgi:hypothetical protein